jgi:hypothetical protein
LSCKFQQTNKAPNRNTMFRMNLVIFSLSLGPFGRWVQNSSFFPFFAFFSVFPRVVMKPLF